MKWALRNKTAEKMLKMVIFKWLVLFYMHTIVQKYSPDVDLYALHKLNRYDAV